MKNNQIYISALGNLLQYYYSDLSYIDKFQSFKRNDLSFNQYLYNFQTFLNEYKVTRNIEKNKVKNVLELTKEFIQSKECDDVDLFAIELKSSKLTRNQLTVSLASKILFLNNPYQIIPMDALTRKAFELNENNFKKYNLLKNKFFNDNQKTIFYYLNYIEILLNEIEEPFKNHLKELEKIRNNRYIDKILWTKGKNDFEN